MAREGVLQKGRSPGGLGPRWLVGGVVGAATGGLILVVTQFLLPGRAGGGTPTAVLFAGLIRGLLISLLTVGLVLIYRSHRIINFAQAALGILATLFVYNLTTLTGFPFFASYIVAIAVAAITGLATDLAFVRRFYNAPRLVLTVFTILMIALLSGIAAQLHERLPLWDLGEQTFEAAARRDIPLPFSSFTFRMGDFPLRFGFAHVFALVTAVLALAGLVLFLRYTRVGVTIRASAENPDRARMLGVSVGVVSMIVWAVAGALAGVAVVGDALIAESFPLGGAPPEALLIPLTAAILARMRSLVVAASIAVGLTMLWDAARFSYNDHEALLFAGLLALVVAGLLLHRERLGRSEEAEAASWKSAEEPRPIPQEMLAIPALQAFRRAGIGVLGLGLLLYPWVVPPRQANLGGYYALVAIVFLSLTVLTGWAGQVSLGQFAFVAVGGVLGGAITARVGLSFWLAIFLVPVLTGAITTLIGFPALRIKGLFLGVVTLMLGFTLQGALFEARYFGWLLPGEVTRPRLFMLDFDDERSMYYLSLGFLILSVLAVVALRRSRAGRLLIGLRDNESNVRAFGVSPVVMRLSAFAISGFLCGLAGFLLAHHQRAVSDTTFPALLGINVFLFAVVGGVASVFGVLLGVVYFAIITDFVTDPIWAIIFGPGALFVILWLFPGGLTQLFVMMRDSVLRIVAQRRQMVVPSLITNYDPATHDLRLVPLGEPIPGAGAAALPGGKRYQRESVLYGGRGRLVETRRRRTDEDAAALGAAARGAEAEE